jgi:hypothetical protein
VSVGQVPLDGNACGLGQLRGVAGAAALGPDESYADRRAELDHPGVAAEASRSPVTVPLGRVPLDPAAGLAPDALSDRVGARGQAPDTRIAPG